jgi:predicted nucleotidyltransferase
VTELDLLAERVGASGRTLRRAAARGLIRCERPSPKRVDVSVRERLYVERHWSLLHDLVAALRTEPNVRLAVLFGSAARGESNESSDLDLLVHLERPRGLAAARLALRLTERVGRDVQIVALRDAESSPLLLEDVLRDGRVLIDRDGWWPKLRRRASEIESRARRQQSELEEAAWARLV